MATRIYETPFAATGDKETLAAADQPDGKVSLQPGWTPDYELANDDPNYRPVGRQEMNGILSEVTEGLGESQLQGFATWQAIDGGWPLGAWVSHNTVVYRSTIESNLTEPGAVGASWTPLPAGIATVAQAQALVDNTLALSPLRLADAFKGENQILGVSGAQRLPGGLIIQWGRADMGSGTNLQITYPLAFPNAAYAITFGDVANDEASVCSFAAGTAGNLLTGFLANGSPAVRVPGVFTWMAIGR